MRVSTFIRGSLVVALVTILLVFTLSVYFKPKIRSKSRPYVRSVDFVCSGDSHEELLDGISFVMYVLCHDEKSIEIAKMWTKCMPWARTVIVPSSVYFESAAYWSVFPNLENEWKHFDLVGVTTYKSLKFLTIEKLKAYVELAHYRPYDVVPLYTSGEYLVPQAVKGHTEEFQHVWDTVLHSVVGYSTSDIRKFDRVEAFFRNTFIITPKWFSLLNGFMKQSKDKVESDSALRALLSSDAHYTEGKRPVAESVFHQQYYEWFPFIFERLPCFYLSSAGATVFTTLRQVSLFENTEPGMDTLYKGL